jgi:alcohol dehydrogenase
MQIPEYYEFFNQLKIASGKRTLENIPAELGSYDSYKPLVIAGKDVTERGLDKKFIKAFAESGMTLGGIFDEVRDYAGMSLAMEAALVFRERGCDSIIALGGGPVVDVAKALNILVSENVATLQPYLEGKPLTKHLKPLIYVYAGWSSGLEATGYLSIDNRVITSDLLFPDVIVIDPRLTPGCCSPCAAESAVIALDHALGAGAGSEPSPMLDAYIHTALRFLAENMKKGIRSPENKDASMKLANASAMAAIAFANSKPGIVHLLAIELERLTGTSAGRFMRVLLPYRMAYMLSKKMKIRDELFLAIAGFDTYSATPEGERTRKGIEAVLELLKTTKKALPQTMKELNVPRYQLKNAAEAASAASETYFSAADCMTLLEHAWEGKAF